MSKKDKDLDSDDLRAILRRVDAVLDKIADDAHMSEFAPVPEESNDYVGSHTKAQQWLHTVHSYQKRITKASAAQRRKEDQAFAKLDAAVKRAAKELGA